MPHRIIDFPWFIVDYFNNKKLSEYIKEIYKVQLQLNKKIKKIVHPYIGGTIFLHSY